MSMFTLAISCLTMSNLPLIRGPKIPGSYAILLFTASDLASITGHIHKWVLFRGTGAARGWQEILHIQGQKQGREEIAHVQGQRNPNKSVGNERRHQRADRNHNHRKLTNLITWTTALSNSMKRWAMPCRATQDKQVMVKSFDKMWSAGEGNGKPLQCSYLENPMNSVKRQKARTLKDELLRSVGAQHASEPAINRPISSLEPPSPTSSHHSRSSQSMELSSLCYAAASH